MPELVAEVRNDRRRNKTCVSAQPGVSIPQTLLEIIEKEYYRKDYESVTSALLNEDVSYENAISTLKRIAEDSLFDE